MAGAVCSGMRGVAWRAPVRLVWNGKTGLGVFGRVMAGMAGKVRRGLSGPRRVQAGMVWIGKLRHGAAAV